MSIDAENAVTLGIFILADELISLFAQKWRPYLGSTYSRDSESIFWLFEKFFIFFSKKLIFLIF